MQIMFYNNLYRFSFVFSECLEKTHKPQSGREVSQANLKTYHHLQLQFVQSVLIVISSTISLMRVYNTWVLAKHRMVQEDPMPGK